MSSREGGQHSLDGQQAQSNHVIWHDGSQPSPGGHEYQLDHHDLQHYIYIC